MFLCETINSTCAEVTSIEETKGRIYFCNLGIKVFSVMDAIFAFCVLQFILDTSLFNKIFTNLQVSNLILL